MKGKNTFRIKPPHIAFSLLFLSWLLDYIFPKFSFIKQPFNRIGVYVFILGIALMLWAFYLFKKNKTPIIPGQKPKFMVVEGAYKFTRNPMYLGVTTALLGAAIYFGNLLSFLLPIIFFVIMNSIYVPFEEKLLEELFGKKYLNYKKKVRRWI